MNFSTYGMMGEGLTIAILITATVSAIGWLVERYKQRRFDALMEAEPEAHADPTATAAKPLAAPPVARARQAE